METAQFIDVYDETLQSQIDFKWNEKHGKELVDENVEFRRNVLMWLDEHDYETDNGLLLKDLFLAEARFAKEVWGVYRYFGLLASKLLEKTGTTYIDDFLVSAFQSFDTYCSTAAGDYEGIDFDLIIQEIQARIGKNPDKDWTRIYKNGLELFTSLQKKLSDDD
ncbi:MAG: hypothetical protein K0R31_1812 [Clostridiales bacterium]|jgi:hypothetical protein|nr:hypothetical protein [Clostridiales bacterium]